jgi:hypothetical protein
LDDTEDANHIKQKKEEKKKSNIRMKTRYERNEKPLLLYNLISHHNTTTEQEGEARLNEQQIDCLTIIRQPNSKGKNEVRCKQEFTYLPLLRNGTKWGQSSKEILM